MKEMKYMAIMPFIEVIAFSLACSVVQINVLLSIGLILIGALAMCFSIHIFFHEYVHYTMSKKSIKIVDYLFSILMGLPLDGYRIHHLNHHKYDNSLNDYSSTWKNSPKGPIPQGVLEYVFGWPRQLIKAKKDVQKKFIRNEYLRKVGQRIPAQNLAILIFVVCLAMVSFKVLFLYMLLVYAGWAFTSLQNYGQHLPIKDYKTTSYYNKFYNKMFFNNGLHKEHHKYPGKAWNELKIMDKGEEINCPHIFAGMKDDLSKILVRNNKKK